MKNGIFSCLNAAGALYLSVLATALPAVADRAADVAWMLQTNLLEKTAAAYNPDLPNVLILGDSISLGYTPFVRKRLAGVANVSRPPCNCAASQFYLREKNGMRDWIGTNRWDVITVNFGIWDGSYVMGEATGCHHYGKDPKLEKLSPLERGLVIRDCGFRFRTTMPEYERNLRTILDFLLSTGATVIFPLTTLTPCTQGDDRCGRIFCYNEIARAVCAEKGVRVLDFEEFSARHFALMKDGCHFNDEGNDLLAERIEQAVRDALSAPNKEEIQKLVAEDLKHEVRPGGVNGQPFWNEAARFFMYPPAFDFPPTKTAVRYRFEVVDAKGKIHLFEAAAPTASLAPVWPKLPTGWTSVMCLAVDRVENRTILRGSRTFWKQAPFTGDYPPAACGYAEFAQRAKAWLFAQPAFKTFLETHDAASCGYWGLAYPSKMIAAIVSALCSGTPTEADLAAARAWADWLYERSEKADRPLAHFPPTYWKTTHANQATATRYAGQVMLSYPSVVGDAMVKLAEKTGEKKYLDWALGIGETYLKLQGEDGSWFLKMDLKTGKEINPNRLMPLGVATFLEKLYEKTKDVRYRTAADRAFASIDKGPLRTWNWEGQFEDVEPDLAYRDLTKHGACSTAMFLLERYPGDKTRLAQARELLRFAEDQFVCWEKPFPDMPASHNLQKVATWIVPCALEQYYWYVPIDASAAKLINTYLALYKAEGNPLDLAKAKALGDAMTRVQWPDGDVPTHWGRGKGCSWWNCLLYDVGAMNALADYQ